MRAPGFTGSLARIRAGLPCVLLLGFFTATAPRPAFAADVLQPWTPPAADSVFAWSAEARARFASNTGDSVSGGNFLAYQRVGQIARRLLRSLGRGNFLQAYAIGPVMDSLQLKTEVTVDPARPEFVLVAVHNPIQRDAGTVGFLYWYQGEELRYQGTYLDGGWRPKMRIWYSGRTDAPYECGILHHKVALGLAPQFLLLKLHQSGKFWNVAQFTGHGPDLGTRGEADWVDVNGDNLPEFVSWVPAASDSMFEDCDECPRTMSERLFVERNEGFVMQDSRLMASPYSTFQLFIRLLVEGNRTAAARLLADPAKVNDALALGWGVRRKTSVWKYEYGEQDETWPRWIVLRYKAGQERPQYVVHFVQREGRWVIYDWIQERRGAPAATPSARGR
jgi:hypothetical protein